MPRPAVMLLAALSVGSAPAPPRPDRDLKRMQGGWVLVSRTAEGRWVLQLGEVRMVVKRDRMTYEQTPSPGAVRDTDYALAVDATKTPKVVEREGVSGLRRGPHWPPPGRAASHWRSAT